MVVKRLDTRSTVALFVAILALLVAGACSDDGGGRDGSSEGASGESTGQDTSGEAWTDVDFERLVGIEVEGYTLQNPTVTEFGNARVEYVEENPAGPVALSARVTFQDCDPFICFDLASEPGEGQRSNIRSLLPLIHIDNPDLVEEIGSDELAGRTVLAAYFRSFVDRDNGHSTANVYQAIAHDGTNIISINVSPSFGPAGLADTAEELEEWMGADEGAAVATDILTAFSTQLD
ncbi:MAG: hypothetical protein RIE08_09885 [Acidimicrobiales bacterium]